MSTEPQSESKAWWQTLPGILTAAAAVITAITGLLVAVHQAGCFDRSAASASLNRSHTDVDSQYSNAPEHGTSPTQPSSAGTRSLTLPATVEVRSEDIIFKLLSARLSPYSPSKVSLKFTVRMTNNHRFPANFWNASFRLLVDETLQAPVNFLDEVVDSNSSKDGEVEFVIPDSVSTVGLQMGEVGEGKPSITIDIPHDKR
jgi:hypothetical protein